MTNFEKGEINRTLLRSLPYSAPRMFPRTAERTMKHIVHAGRSFVVYPEIPNNVVINAPVNWNLLLLAGCITVCPYNDWLKRLMRFFGFRKMVKSYAED